MGKSMVSCRFSHQPIHWVINSCQFMSIHVTSWGNSDGWIQLISYLLKSTTRGAPVYKHIHGKYIRGRFYEEIWCQILDLSKGSVSCQGFMKQKLVDLLWDKKVADFFSRERWTTIKLVLCRWGIRAWNAAKVPFFMLYSTLGNEVERS